MTYRRVSATALLFRALRLSSHLTPRKTIIAIAPSGYPAPKKKNLRGGIPGDFRSFEQNLENLYEAMQGNPA
jgi:hypothetical protein